MKKPAKQKLVNFWELEEKTPVPYEFIMEHRAYMKTRGLSDELIDLFWPIPHDETKTLEQ